MQKFILFLHHPLYAVAVVLSSFLVFSGLGSAWLGHLQACGTAGDGRRLLSRAVIAIVALGTVYLLSLGNLLDQGNQVAGRGPRFALLFAKVDLDENSNAGIVLGPLSIDFFSEGETVDGVNHGDLV